jgi:glutaredoxin
MNQILTLYSGPNCHLCEQAKSLIYPVLQGTDWVLQEVYIADNSNEIDDDSKRLKEQYGLRIPVIVTPNGAEKCWPFTAGQVKRLLVGEL